jgi:hypothetical protein
LKINPWRLIWPVLATLIVPLIAAWFVYPETHLPPGFGVFPPAFVVQMPPFWLPYFLLMLLVVLVVVAFLLMPQWFGFKPSTDPLPPVPEPAKLPWWFWVGLVTMGFFLWLMFARFTIFGDLVYYAFSPMWWGFIVALDGVVYRRTGGSSLMSKRPHTVWLSMLVSVVGWFYFEYANYFVLGNWYYPDAQGTIPSLSHATIVVLFVIAYTTVWPAIFEWYTLLCTFPKLGRRYANGPKIALPGGWLVVIGLALIGVMVFLPLPFFWVVWIGPMAVIVGHLVRLGVWTPFTDIAKGNWTAAILIALSSLFNGFLWEFWNWGSAQPAGLPPTNPNYWIYDIPYVNVIHICAEMPLLGYAGYLPFGILVWVVFLWAGQLFGFNAQLDLPPASQSKAPPP